jgi:hypothetical protein
MDAVQGVISGVIQGVISCAMARSWPSLRPIDAARDLPAA